MPATTAPTLLQATRHDAAGRLLRGGELCGHAFSNNSNLACVCFGHGNIHAQREDFAIALACFQCALLLKPNLPEYLFAVAFCLARLGRQLEAIAFYSRAVALRPNFASAWLNLGVTLIADGRDQLAELCYHQALAANPRLVSAHLNLGNLERSRRRFGQARQHYDRALTLDPKNSNIHVAFAYYHLEQRQFPQAWQSLRLAREINATNPEIANAQGILMLAEAASLQSSEMLESAVDAFRQAEALGHKTAASNRGNALLRLGRVHEALDAHQSAVDRDPHHPGARYNLALTQLRLGDYAHGWPNYEIRWAFREVHPRPRRFPQPRWRGEPPLTSGAPRRLFIYAEQGLGDTLQFVRYLPEVVRLGFRVLLEVQPPLVRLLNPLVRSLSGEVIACGDPLPVFDLHCPLLSLPAIFRTTLETVPATIPYLHVDAEVAPGLTAARAGELFSRETQAALERKPRIGIAWAGNPEYRADRERSTHLGTFLSLLEISGAHWISLQKGDPAAQISSIPSEIAPCDASSHDRDLADTAALVMNLDLIVTTDTVIAHLAGALGKPLWLLLPWQSDWRWMQDTPATPWYPQARLFRQRAPNDWAELVARVRKELEIGLKTQPFDFLPIPQTL